MNSKKYKIVCSDLDGTMFGSNGKASERNLRAVDRLAERGVTYDDPLPPEVLLFPRGTFAGRSPGDLVALTAGGGRLSLVPVVADDETRNIFAYGTAMMFIVR
jgi:hypothetical protein